MGRETPLPPATWRGSATRTSTLPARSSPGPAHPCSKDVPFSIFVIAIRLKAEDLLLGTSGVHQRDTNVVETGYILHPDHWRRGYGTEAVRAVIGLDFRQHAAGERGHRSGLCRKRGVAGPRAEGRHDFGARRTAGHAARRQGRSNSGFFSISRETLAQSRDRDLCQASPKAARCTRRSAVSSG